MATKNARMNANKNKKGGSSRAGGIHSGGSVFGGEMGASFDRVDKAIKALGAAQLESEEELRAQVEQLKKDTQEALETRIAIFEKRNKKEKSQTLQQTSSEMAATNAHQSELKRLRNLRQEACR